MKHLWMRLVRFDVVAVNQPMEAKVVKRYRRFNIPTIDVGQDTNRNQHRLHCMEKRSSIRKDRHRQPVSKLPLYRDRGISARPEVIDGVLQRYRACLALGNECTVARWIRGILNQRLVPCTRMAAPPDSPLSSALSHLELFALAVQYSTPCRHFYLKYPYVWGSGKHPIAAHGSFIAKLLRGMIPHYVDLDLGTVSGARRRLQ